MSNYTKITDFAAKDGLLHGNPSKVVTGTGLGAEFDAIATAVATKVDVNGALGTPSSGVATNLTGIAAGLTAGNATNATNATNASQLGGVAASGYARSGANADITSMTALTAPTVAANPIRATDLQVQLTTAFTTGGTATAFTLTPAPAITANAANQRFRVTFNAAAGATPTLAVSGLTAKNLKYKDSTGTKQAITSTQVPSGWVSDVEYDGTDWVVLSVLSLGKSIAASGYTKMGDGLILQWGTSAVTTGTPLAVTFSLTFPTNVYSITVSVVNPSSSNNTSYLTSPTTSGFSANVSGTAGVNTVHWMAIGN